MHDIHVTIKESKIIEISVLSDTANLKFDGLIFHFLQSKLETASLEGVL